MTKAIVPAGGAQVVASPAQSPLDMIIASWLDAKFNRSRSERTRVAYMATMRRFRAFLAVYGADIDHSDIDMLAVAATRFASIPRANGETVSPTTQNHRLAVLSSFYRYIIRHRLLRDATGRPLFLSNPLDVERARVQGYAKAKPQKAEAVAAALGGVDTSTMRGARDYAILSLGVNTGKRGSEIAGLCLGDLAPEGDAIAITWRRVKGGDTLTTRVTESVAEALLDYAVKAYGEQWPAMAPNTPLWRSVNRNTTKAARPFTIKGVEGVCKRWLGTSKAHAMRHTFAVNMLRAGASVVEISKLLGHSNVATTSTYLEQLEIQENKYSGALAELYGMRRKTRPL